MYVDHLMITWSWNISADSNFFNYMALVQYQFSSADSASLESQVIRLNWSLSVFELLYSERFHKCRRRNQALCYVDIY